MTKAFPSDFKENKRRCASGNYNDSIIQYESSTYVIPTMLSCNPVKSFEGADALARLVSMPSLRHLELRSCPIKAPMPTQDIRHLDISGHIWTYLDISGHIWTLCWTYLGVILLNQDEGILTLKENLESSHLEDGDSNAVYWFVHCTICLYLFVGWSKNVKNSFSMFLN